MKFAITLAAAAVLAPSCATGIGGDPVLPSWRDGETRSAIIEFVGEVTDESSPNYVPPAMRIAAFDNDGTLWCEQPAYFQLLFAIDRIKARSGEHPEWKTTQPFKAAIEGDMKAVAASGVKGILELVMATHSGMTEEEYRATAREWLTTVRHPRFQTAWKNLTYVPQVELLEYLRANGFKTFIVSGGGMDFVRAICEDAYGIPPEQVIGSSVDARFEMRDGKPVVIKQPELHFIDDKDGKPVGIHRHIGRRPILAVGNSDGDLQMLQYTTIGRTSALGILVHHDDAEREYAYDRESHIGKLDKALDEAPERGWIVISMKNDWKRVFQTESSRTGE